MEETQGMELEEEDIRTKAGSENKEEEDTEND